MLVLQHEACFYFRCNGNNVFTYCLCFVIAISSLVIENDKLEGNLVAMIIAQYYTYSKKMLFFHYDFET